MPTPTPPQQYYMPDTPAPAVQYPPQAYVQPFQHQQPYAQSDQMSAVSYAPEQQYIPGTPQMTPQLTPQIAPQPPLQQLQQEEDAFGIPPSYDSAMQGGGGSSSGAAAAGIGAPSSHGTASRRGTAATSGSGSTSGGPSILPQQGETVFALTPFAPSSTDELALTPGAPITLQASYDDG
ncbi:hypothetical protein HK104_000170, partial [Borealophlyctis nickersoniae]